MYTIDVMSRVPVYEQVVEQTERFILTGILSPGDKIPSVRNLSVELSVNPNTIQKAVSELDRRGIVYSIPGKGCFVSEQARALLSEARRGGLMGIKKQLAELKLAGIGRGEIVGIVDEIYGTEREGGGND
ncbi:MAG: GntR family transcriptional regulator [Butyrivibrio sp.]|nr:GntR family transcriptional regulator [Butyrivibrio sp.]